MIKIPRRTTPSEKRPVVISSEIHLLKRISPSALRSHYHFHDLTAYYIKILQAFLVCEESSTDMCEQMAHTCPSPQETQYSDGESVLTGLLYMSYSVIMLMIFK